MRRAEGAGQVVSHGRADGRSGGAGSQQRAEGWHRSIRGGRVGWGGRGGEQERSPRPSLGRRP